MSPLQRIGGRKFALGIALLTVVGVWVETAILMKVGAGEIAALATVVTTLSAGVFGVIWGNVQEHKAQNGKT